MSYNSGSKKYIITETREPYQCEFIFTNGYRDNSEKKRLWRYLETEFGIGRAKIHDYQLPTDSNNRRMYGFRIVNIAKEDGYEPFNGVDE